MTIKGVTSSMLAIPLLFLSLSLITRVTHSAFTRAEHPLKNHLAERESLHTTDRLSRYSGMESWKRRIGEARIPQKFNAVAGPRGRKLNMRRSLNASNSSVTSATEVNALLGFRSSMQMSPFSALASWTPENNSSHCSTWTGVYCNGNGEVTEIYLPNMGLNGTITPMIGDLVHLEGLNLSGSSLWGPIPSELMRCHNLRVLDLSRNSLNGSIPASFGELHRLEVLNLGWNQLTGFIPSSLSSCQSLASLLLLRNQLNGSIPTSLSELQLLELNLIGNKLTGHIPSDLGFLNSLEALHLEANNLEGSIPPEIYSMNSLLVLNLGYNNLSGEIPPGLDKLTELRVLLLSDNKLTGTIPQDLGGCSSLRFLLLRRNNLTGGIPKSLGNLSSLVSLDLSDNNLSDNALALSMIFSQSPYLEQLDLAKNKIFGSLQLDFTKFASLKYLSVADNMLTGGIPPSFARIPSSLVLVDFSQNGLTGELPAQVLTTHLASLLSFNFSHNHLEGTIPSWIGNLKSLQVLDLSGNKLTGIIPQSFSNLTAFKVPRNARQDIPQSSSEEVVHPGFFFTDNGTLSIDYFMYITYTSLDLSSNALQGQIPQELAGLIGMKYLNLSNNKFEGSILSGVQNLEALETLDLSRNRLSGPIPPSISSFVSHYNVSFNNLSGPIPTGSQFNTFTDMSTYLPGNPGLCGEVIQRPCLGGHIDPLPNPLDTEFGISEYLSIEGFEIGAASGFLIVVVTTLAWAPARLFVFGAAGRREAPSAYGLFKYRS